MKYILSILFVMLFVVYTLMVYLVGFHNGYPAGNKAADKWFAEALEQPNVDEDRFKIDIERCSPGLWIDSPKWIGSTMYFPKGKGYRFNHKCAWDYRNPICWQEIK